MKRYVRFGILILLMVLLIMPILADELPEAQTPEYEEIIYGMSGEGRELKAYRYGSGENVLVATFAMHGYEDNFPRDGEALVLTAEAVMAELEANPIVDAYNWTVYILPCLNPDGLASGWTNYGPGRCTTTWINASGELLHGNGIDMNRCFPTYFSVSTDARNRTGPSPMSCLEARALDEFIRSVRGSKDNILIDVHGWLRQTITTSPRLLKVMNTYFSDNSYRNYNGGNGYLIAYAHSLGYETCLLELPSHFKNLASYVDSDCINRVVLTIREIIKLQPSVCDTNGHNYITDAKEPTCTEYGYSKTYCTVCDDKTSIRYVPKGHSEDPESISIRTPATATQFGLQVSSCLRCGVEMIKTLPKVFDDVDAGAYYANALDYCYAAGYISGTSSNTFSPNMQLSRGMLVTMLYRMSGQPQIALDLPFTDVPADKYYADAVAWAYYCGIASGITETQFCPDKIVTREQAMTFFFRYVQSLGLDNGQRSDQQFLDSSRLHSYAQEAAQWSVANGIICGDDRGNLLPLNNTTRAQAVTIVKRVVDYIAAQTTATE